MSAASTRAVLDHHLAALLAGDVDGLMRDYADDSLFISDLEACSRDSTRSGRCLRLVPT